jgi:phosphate transport system protein
MGGRWHKAGETFFHPFAGTVEHVRTDRDLRPRFHRDLAAIDDKVCRMFDLLRASLSEATTVLTTSDREGAMRVVERDAAIDALDDELEATITRILHLQSPVASDLRYLVTVLRVAPELERSADLVEHIAARAAYGLVTSLTPAITHIVRLMGDVAERMWATASAAWGDRTPDAVAELEALDDQMDALHDDLRDQLRCGDLPLGPAVEMALVGRFYERLGDHALHVTERLGYAAGT